MEVPMPLMFLAMYSYWWKAALMPKKPTTSVIVLMPEEGAPELDTVSGPISDYQG
jgi:hypothetical protein